MTETTDEPRPRSILSGGLYVLAAKVFFMVTGLVQQALLPLAIGEAGYGALSRVMAVANILNNVAVSSSTQGVSRATAASEGKERTLLRAALRIHAPLAVGYGLFMCALAPFVAWYQGAPHIRLPLLVMALVLAIYGVYAPLIGYLNGRRSFARQASLDGTAAALRTVGLVGVGWLFVSRGGSGVVGATVGGVLAASLVFGVALRWTGTGERPTAGTILLPVGAYLAGIFPVILAQACTNGVMQADIILLGHYLSAAATGDDPRKAADEWVAAYRACQLFAFLPYQLLFSVTQVLFPMLAKVKAEGTKDDVERLVAKGSRLGAVLCGMMVAVIVALPRSMLAFAYGAKISGRGAEALHHLAIAQGLFAMLGLATTVLVSLRREIWALVLTATTLVLVGGFGATVIPLGAFGAEELVLSAKATGTAMAIGTVIAAIVVWRLAGAFIPWKTALRVSAAVGLAWLAGGRTPLLGRPLTLVAAAACAAAYVVFLVVTGELGRAELAMVRAMAKRRSG